MYPLKHSTALDVLFFAHDVNGDGVTGLVDAGFTKRISKNGAAFAAMTVTISERENGFYSFPLSTSHSDTLGILTMSFSHASCKRVNMQYRVHARIPDDLAYPAVTGRSSAIDASGRHLADVDTIKTNPVVNAGTVTFPTTATLASTANITAAAGCAVSSIGANVITATSINADAIQAAKIQAAALNGKGDWNIGKTGYALTATTGLGNQTANITGTITTATNLTTNNDKTGYSLTQAFPANFSALSISAGGLVDILQAAADKVWGSTTRTLSAFSTALALSVWDVLESAVVTASTMGLKMKNNLDAAISSRLSTAGYTAPDNTSIAAILVDTGTTLDGNITAIKTKTDSLTFTKALEVDSNIQSVNGVTVVGTGAVGDEWGP